METNFDFSKVYYKVTNEQECHNGYRYKDGLNILEEKFNDNPNASCVAGGFYFTDYEHLPRFFEYGTWIREVTIPTDARVVKDPEGDKWRTDKIILGNRYHINNDFDKWFDKEKFNWIRYSGYLAEYFFEDFDKWFDTNKFNWYYSNYLAEFCSEHFDKWFDPKKFDWRDSYYLSIYCSAHFDKWFDPKKFDWYCADVLIKNYNSEFTLWKQANPKLLKYIPEKYR